MLPHVKSKTTSFSSTIIIPIIFCFLIINWLLITKYGVFGGVERSSNCCLTCRGYGFVKFGEESEQKKAIEECQGTMLGGKPLRLSIAVAKR